MRWWYSAADIQPLIDKIGQASVGIVKGQQDIVQRLGALERAVAKLAQTQADLDAALTAFEAAQAAAIQEIDTAVSDILAKVPPAVDLSAEVGRIQAAQQSLQTAADAIKADDAAPKPAPAPAPQP